MSVNATDADPALTLTVPDGPADQRSVTVLFPEHVTAQPQGSTDGIHLYLFHSGRSGPVPQWQQHGQTLEYTRDLGGVSFLARATLMDDGVLFHYEFLNHTSASYSMITAVTDPRFHAVFYDPRLERTYVHFPGGFQLLAAGTPERLSMLPGDWLPVRYLAPYREPVRKQLVVHMPDGITRRYTAQAADIPVIATLSEDKQWVAASFAHDPQDVWSNPELTCQHVDPQVPLPPNGHAQYEVKLLLIQGSLKSALKKVQQQLPTLH